MEAVAAREWLWLNFKIGTLSVGVASRVLLFEEAMVRRYRWVSADEFQELLTLAQMLPGPNLVTFSACAGSRLVSPVVNALALFALIAPGALIAIWVCSWVPLDNPHVQTFFRGCSIGTFLLAGRLVWSLILGLRFHAKEKTSTKFVKTVGRYVLAAALLACSWAGFPLGSLILIFAGLSLVWEFVL